MTLIVGRTGCGRTLGNVIVSILSFLVRKTQREGCGETLSALQNSFPTYSRVARKRLATERIESTEKSTSACSGGDDSSLLT